VGAIDTVAGEVGLGEIFEPLARGEIDEFLARCSDRLVFSVWGTAPRPTTLSRADLPGWYGGLRALTADTFSSEVVLNLSLGLENVVMLRHRFSFLGQPRRYDTVNHCVLLRGQLVAWFSRPSAAGEYAAAWRGPAGDAAHSADAGSARLSLSTSAP